MESQASAPEPERTRARVSELEIRLAECERAAEAREAQQTQLAELEHAYAHAPVGLCLVDATLRFVRVNEQLAAINGRPVAEHLGRTIKEVIPALAAHVEPLYRQVFRSGEPVRDVEVRGVTAATPESERVWLVSSYPLKAADGTVRGASTAVLEITDRARAEAALRESERRYRLLADHVSDVIFTADLRGGMTYVSPSVTGLLGCRVGEVLAHPFEARCTADSARRARSALAALLANPDAPRTVELEMVRSDGSTVLTEARLSIRQDAEGRPVELVGIARDVTERRETEQQLRLQAAALEAAANAIVITDHAGAVLWVNPAFTTLTGYSAEEVKGRNLRVLKSGRHERAFYEQLWTTIQAGRVWQGELINRRRDGTLYTDSQTITPVRDAQGRASHFVAIKQDVTEQRRAEAELQRQRETLYQSEKLAAMGQLLAGVAHELNNPLSVLVGQAYLLLEQIKEGPLAKRGRQISEAAERCARIVKNFLALARQYPPERQQVALNHVVQGVVELLAYPLRVDNIEVAYDLAVDLSPFWADPHQLHQVVVNLVTNAHQAMRDVSPRQRRLTLTTQPLPHGTGVQLAVADTGPGIPPEVRHRVFEPFFTTKPPGQGTGLGLSLCQGIVEGHGGTMGVDSEPGQGARFWVNLPIGEPPAATAEVSRAEAAPRITGKTILVVDDESTVVGVLAEILGQDGHRVERAADGLVALDKLRERRYDLILSDIRMPALDGPGLYRELERREPTLLRRFVFMTGDVLNSETRALVERTGVLSLSKPFTVEEVRRLVQRVLGHS